MTISKVIWILLVAVAAAVLYSVSTGSARGEQNMNKYGQPELNAQEIKVIRDKGTERPFTGKYLKHKEEGDYTCRQCGAVLFKSGAKFDSGTGWPSFDKAVKGAVLEKTDADGRRTEILCAKCGAHLGHVFKGEGLTENNTRHCVNSASLGFCPLEAKKTDKTDKAVFAGGCFWGVEYHFEKLPGVISVFSGYTGGTVNNPTYEQVCSGKTGHAEAVEITFDPQKVDYETLTKLFLEIHDPTQLNRQGPDIGTQYRSEIFVNSPEQRKVAEKLLAVLKDKGLEVKTKVTDAATFWKAEGYHQDYYIKTGKQPYCHVRKKRFE